MLLGQYRKMKEVLALTQGGDRILGLGGDRTLALTQGGERTLALTQGGERMLSGSSEEELSRSLVLRALTHKAHCDIIRTEVTLSLFT